MACPWDLVTVSNWRITLLTMDFHYHSAWAAVLHELTVLDELLGAGSERSCHAVSSIYSCEKHGSWHVIPFSSLQLACASFSFVLGFQGCFGPKPAHKPNVQEASLSRNHEGCACCPGINLHAWDLGIVAGSAALPHSLD